MKVELTLVRAPDYWDKKMFFQMVEAYGETNQRLTCERLGIKNLDGMSWLEKREALLMTYAIYPDHKSSAAANFDHNHRYDRRLNICYALGTVWSWEATNA